MKIAMDSSDMDALCMYLHQASVEICEASPRLPGATAFGSAELAGAAASFESAMRREGYGLRDRWTSLESGVRASFDDMSEVEARISTALDQVLAGIGRVV